VSVLTSTLQRTIQTAAHLPFAQQRLSALDEVNAGICEHMSYEQVAQAYPAVAQARAADKLGYRCVLAAPDPPSLSDSSQTDLGLTPCTHLSCLLLLPACLPPQVP
jgi:hypothetical protein